MYWTGPKLDVGNYPVGVDVGALTCFGAWRQTADLHALTTGRFVPFAHGVNFSLSL
jgi:hypothetical protein